MATKITKKNEQIDKDKELKRVANRVDNLSNIFDVIQRENDATFADLQKRVHKLENSSSKDDDRVFNSKFARLLYYTFVIFTLVVALLGLISLLF